MKPYIICHMITSLDGGLHPSRWTTSPDGTRSQWSGAYEKIHKELDAQAWMVGRVTMAEISRAEAHAPSHFQAVARPMYAAESRAASYAIVIDTHGKVHFNGPDIDGDHVIVVLGNDVADSHLAELQADGVSYIVSKSTGVDLADAMRSLWQEFGISRLLLEGGGGINGSMLAAGLVDEISLLVAPVLDARNGADRVVEFGADGLAGRCTLSLIGCEDAGHGLLHLRYKVGA